MSLCKKLMQLRQQERQQQRDLAHSTELAAPLPHLLPPQPAAPLAGKGQGRRQDQQQQQHHEPPLQLQALSSQPTTAASAGGLADSPSAQLAASPPDASSREPADSVVSSPPLDRLPYPHRTPV
jgi:hypothetical protein